MSEQLVKRLRELSNAVTRADWNEFSMRIPVEKDRDADFVLLQAADKIAALEADAARYRDHARNTQVAAWCGIDHNAPDCLEQLDAFIDAHIASRKAMQAKP